MTTFLQIAALVAPPIAYWVAYQLCVALRRREGPERTERAGVVVRDSGGGYRGLGEANVDSEGERTDGVDGVGDALRRAPDRRAGRRMMIRLPEPLTEQAEEIDGVWNFFLIGAVAVFALIAVLVVVILVRVPPSRRPPASPGPREHPVRAVLHRHPVARRPGRCSWITFITVRSVDAEAESDADVDLVVDVSGSAGNGGFEYPESGVVVNGTEQDIPELVLPCIVDRALQRHVGGRGSTPSGSQASGTSGTCSRTRSARSTST